jgi:hypothetical protein
MHINYILPLPGKEGKRGNSTQQQTGIVVKVFSAFGGFLGRLRPHAAFLVFSLLLISSHRRASQMCFSS